MLDEADVYQRLRRHLDKMPVALPSTASGVELRILRRLFAPEEAEVALLLSAVPETLDRIVRRARGTGLTREQIEPALDRLVEKGAILGGGGRGGRPRRYSKAQLAIGMYELQVDQLTEALQRDVEQYFQEGFGNAVFKPPTSQMRTIPVNARFVPERQVGHYDDARKLVEDTSGPIAVMNCVCRQGKDLTGEPCRVISGRRVCMTFDGTARHMIDSGTGEAVGRDEALELLNQAEEDGLVLQPENTRDPSFMCFCCGCCCGVLTTAKRFPRPAEYLHSNYRVAVSAELCAGCGTCHSRCPMDALDGGEEGTEVDPDRCIGCGACVGTCPSEALSLVMKEKETVPPRDRRSLYGRITIERFGVVGATRMALKALFGGQI